MAVRPDSGMQPSPPPLAPVSRRNSHLLPVPDFRAGTHTHTHTRTRPTAAQTRPALLLSSYGAPRSPGALFIWPRRSSHAPCPFSASLRFALLLRDLRIDARVFFWIAARARLPRVRFSSWCRLRFVFFSSSWCHLLFGFVSPRCRLRFGLVSSSTVLWRCPRAPRPRLTPHASDDGSPRSTSASAPSASGARLHPRPSLILLERLH